MSSAQSIGELISIIYRKAHIYYRKKLDPLGITHGQGKIFKYLGANKEATQQDIANFNQLEKSSTSYLINRMVAKGYIKKELDTEDRRFQKLHLTDKGRAQLKEVESTIDGWIEQIFNGFSPNEKEKLFEFLNRMVENIKFFSENNKNYERYEETAE